MMKRKETDSANKGKIKPDKVKKGDFPIYCDFGCSEAAFSPNDITGACRKELAVWCKLFGQYNNKNSICIGKKHH